MKSALSFVCAFFLLFATAAAAIPASGAPKTEAEKRAERASKAAEVKDYPPTPWEKAFTQESDSYIVKTNTSPEVASYIAQLMDYAQENYRAIFGFEGEIPKLPIFAYRTPEEYFNIGNGPAGSCGVFSYRTDGFAQIHVAYTKFLGKTGPTSILLHEGTHQFVHLAVAMPIPEAHRDYFADNTTSLHTMPRWLNEGLATYMEVSYYNGKKLVVGEINENRLRHLRHMLREETNPSLKELFHAHTLESFQTPHYAVAWGLTYWFLHDRSSKNQSMKREMLKKYIVAIRKGFFEDPEKEFPAFLQTVREKNQPFFDAWDAHVEQKGYETFISLTIGKEELLPDWEKQWAEWILKLDAHDPWGGLRGKR